MENGDFLRNELTHIIHCIENVTNYKHYVFNTLNEFRIHVKEVCVNLTDEDNKSTSHLISTDMECMDEEELLEYESKDIYAGVIDKDKKYKRSYLVFKLRLYAEAETIEDVFNLAANIKDQFKNKYDINAKDFLISDVFLDTLSDDTKIFKCSLSFGAVQL